MFGARYSPIAILVGLVVLILVKMSNRSDAGEEVLAQAKDMVATIPCYSKDPKNAEYVDWLVTDAHDHCFNDSYQFNYSRRGRSKDTIDIDRYLHDLFSRMIDQAQTDHATEVADDLGKLRASLME